MSWRSSKAFFLPLWTWAFVAACLGIPVVSHDAATALVLGAGGAAACAVIARDASREEAIRIALCATVTLFCWALYVATLLELLTPAGTG